MELKKTQIISYGLGGLGKNIAWMLVSSYTLYYYNSVIGLSASFIAVLLMTARIFDAFNDPFMAVIVTKTKSPWGAYKPWILSGAILNSFVMAALFTVPKSLTADGTKLYLTALYFLCGITYTLTDIPYWAVIPAITKPGKDRETITLFTRIMSGLGAGLATALTIHLVSKAGGGYTKECYYKGFSIIACCTAVIYSLFTVITVLNLPDEKYIESQDYSIKEVFKTLIHNDQAMIIALIIIAFYSGTSITPNFAIYVFDHDLLRPDLYTPYMVIVGIAEFFAMIVLYPLLRKKYTNRAILIAGIIMGALGYTGFLTLVFMKTLTFISLIPSSILIGLSMGITYVLITVFIANAVDYGQAKSGKRQNSLVSSVQTLMSKLATSFSIFITGLGIDWIGFSKTTVQDADTLIRERLFYSVPSLILVLIALTLLIKRKDL